MLFSLNCVQAKNAFTLQEQDATLTDFVISSDIYNFTPSPLFHLFQSQRDNLHYLYATSMIFSRKMSFQSSSPLSPLWALIHGLHALHINDTFKRMFGCTWMWAVCIRNLLFLAIPWVWVPTNVYLQEINCVSTIYLPQSCMSVFSLSCSKFQQMLSDTREWRDQWRISNGMS